jgi:hypothetical protein
MEAKMDIFTTRFIVKASDSLKSKTAAWQSDLKELLVQTSVWIKAEGHRTTWKTEDREAQVKLLFLASLKQYSNIADFESLVGALTLSVRTFDKWWSIEKVDDEEIVEQVEKDLEPSVVEQLEQTGRPVVDTWICNLRDRTLRKRNKGE